MKPRLSTLKLSVLTLFFLLLSVKTGFGTVTFTSGSQSPADLAQRDDLHPYLNASIQPYSNVSTTINCSLYVDDVLNQTVNDIANNTVAYLNSSTLSSGDHAWYINCTDDNWATQTQSEIRTIGIGSSFSRCAVLIDDYGSYQLTGDIINSATSQCINIPANNVTLDCQGHTIDGDDVADYGIYVYRSTSQDTNITIKNCSVTDWDSIGIFLRYASSNTLENLTLTSNPDYALYLYYSDSNTLTNITSNFNAVSLRLYHSDSNTLTNITSNSNYYGLYLYYSDFNTIKNSKFQDNSYGIYLYYAGVDGANKIYNNLFNQTTNFYFDGTVYTNYWNTTRQAGTRIYSAGTEIGGNYWTNSNGNGYSDTCTDADADGFCDGPYYLVQETKTNSTLLQINSTNPGTHNLSIGNAADIYATLSVSFTNESAEAGTINISVNGNLLAQVSVPATSQTYTFDNVTLVANAINNFTYVSDTSGLINVTETDVTYNTTNIDYLPLSDEYSAADSEVKGIVLDMTMGLPVPEATVKLTTKETCKSFSTTTDSKGEFVINFPSSYLTSGKNTLLILANTTDGRKGWLRNTIFGDYPHSSESCPLTNTIEVRGKIFSNGLPLSNAYVKVVVEETGDYGNDTTDSNGMYDVTFSSEMQPGEVYNLIITTTSDSKRGWMKIRYPCC